MEFQEPLDVHLVVLTDGVLLLSAKDKRGESRQEDGCTVHSLYSEAGSWVRPVTLGHTSVHNSAHINTFFKSSRLPVLQDISIVNVFKLYDYRAI